MSRRIMRLADGTLVSVRQTPKGLIITYPNGTVTTITTGAL